MRFATLNMPNDRPLAGLTEFASRSQLDLLELRYRRPHTLPIEDENTPLVDDYASGSAPQLQQLSKQLYLDPQLHLLTDAGWGNAFLCVERAAEVLVESGNRDLRISAVRGSNLLPLFDQLQREGHDFAHRDTHIAWSPDCGALKCADLHLGAGPLEVALAEGARVVVAGCADESAAVTAMAVRQFGWSWKEYHLLAAAAAGASLARSYQYYPALSTTNTPLAPCLDLHASGTIRGPFAQDSLAALSSRPLLRGADVVCDWRNAQTEHDATSGFQISGLQGTATNDRWHMDLMLFAGYRWSGILEAGNGHDATLMLESLVDQLGNEEPTVEASFDLTGTTAGADRQFMYVSFHGMHRTACERCGTCIDQLVQRLPTATWWEGTSPRLEIQLSHWPTSLPRDAVDLAVDTRPAHEWV